MIQQIEFGRVQTFMKLSRYFLQLGKGEKKVKGKMVLRYIS